MTDKEEIIIDGKGCGYKTWDKDCALTGDNHGDNMKPCKFIDEKSCYFKQLARKTQECEALKKRNEDNERFYLKQYAKKDSEVLDLTHKLNVKTQEYEELKEEISKLQLNEYHYKNELKKYKKGIHKYRNLLKYEINNLRLSRREFLKMVGRYPKFEKDNIKLALDTFNRKLELIDNPSCYRKALEEIEGYVQSQLDGFGNDVYAMNKVAINHIQDIINKAKGEENAI